MAKGIEIRTSPHLKKVLTVDQIMRSVVLALLPVSAFAVYQFGLSVLLLLITTTVVAVATEWLFARLSGQGNTVSDWSAVITGLLLGLTLPPGFPLWMAAVAAFVGIALGKALFGGLGYNVMNPALVGRAFVQAAFPVAITTWTPAFAPERFSELIPSTLTLPFMQPVPIDDWVAGLGLDAWSGATPLALQKFQQIELPLSEVFSGTIAGSAGETSAILILVCGLWLAWRRMLDWRIPASVMAGAVLTALPFWLLDPTLYPSPWFVLCSGGLMLGAWFMASDMVASPVTARGAIIYGLFIGVLTVIIRLFGGLVEGVMYAILLANALGPLISGWTQPRVYGAGSRPKA
ncbi:RnfABCDGE type electron transport complex subunit D [Marichromatium gracile]|uniref:Ion-translocating oxidoreductase complex subunit D n=1 Tax=Marichromatium gracile TaxID=1048 RepID=A0ABR5VN39_MARGR|nr:RnfABCDGE type electron transport complex subunit D [Marichromatium gracile]KXX65643.1 electron transporter RnfD [Marichromatium gracile]MBO8085326.1 RnfABCDGE type electron transport complex subunit D [Marichromatium sp.]